MKISTFFWEREVRGIVAQNHAALPVSDEAAHHELELGSLGALDARGMQLAERISMTHDNRFRLVRAATLALSEPLSAEDFVVQSMPDASPAKWHLAHTTWFWEEFVLQHAADRYQFHDETFRYLFNSSYN